MKTMICLILDRSGSMGGRENDVVNGVNAFIEEQKKNPDPATIAFVRFDSENVERFRQMANLAEVAPLARAEFEPRGGTPLLDAVGRTIVELDNDWARERPDRAVVVIVTDGEENSSREYTKEKVKQMITAREDSKQWAFIYLGADVDAFQEAGALGIKTLNTASYTKSAAGMAAAYHAVGQTVNSMRQTGVMDAQNLGGDIAEDGTVTKPTASPTPWVPPHPTTNTWAPPK